MRHAGTDNFVFFIEFKLYYAITENQIMSDEPNNKRRDFLQLSTVTIGAVGTAAFIWPFLKSMSPAEDTLALGTTEVDVSAIEEGQSITVKWRGKPVFIRKRTKEEIDEAKVVNIADLRDPEQDIDRVKKDEWLVLVGVCTHLGCVPLGQKFTDSKGEYKGWYCPCHGGHYDTCGSIRKGPEPKNLPVPPYSFLNDSTIKIG